MNDNGYNKDNPFADNPFEENKEDYLFQTVTGRGRNKTYVWSLAAVIAGVLALVFSCLIYAGLIFCVLAVVFALISIKNLGFFDRMAITGLILGIIGAVIGATLLITFMSMSEEDLQKLIDSMEQLEGTDSTNTPNL